MAVAISDLSDVMNEWFPMTEGEEYIVPTGTLDVREITQDITWGVPGVTIHPESGSCGILGNGAHKLFKLTEDADSGNAIENCTLTDGTMSKLYYAINLQGGALSCENVNVVGWKMGVSCDGSYATNKLNWVGGSFSMQKQRAMYLWVVNSTFEGMFFHPPEDEQTVRVAWASGLVFYDCYMRGELTNKATLRIHGDADNQTGDVTIEKCEIIGPGPITVTKNKSTGAMNVDGVELIDGRVEVRAGMPMGWDIKPDAENCSMSGTTFDVRNGSTGCDGIHGPCSVSGGTLVQDPGQTGVLHVA